MKEMKFSGKQIDRVSFLCSMFDLYLAQHTYFGSHNNYYERFFLSNIKNQSSDPYPEALEQVLCYLFLFNPESKKEIDAILSFEVIGKREVAIKGLDIMELGISPGPRIKLLLEEAYIQVLQFPEQNNREDLIRFAQEKIRAMKTSMN